MIWSAGAYDGGSPVIDYRISYHAGNDAYLTLATGIALPQFTSTALTANVIYTFKIESRSLVGYSDYSSEIVIRAAAKPSQPIAPQTVVISNTGVKITWTAPFNGGSPITAYLVKIGQTDGINLSTELASCDGSNSGILSAASCTIPISTLQASPFNLAWGASVYA